MGAKRKCIICGNLIEDVNESVPYKGRYAHRKCFNSTLKMVKTTKDKQLKEKQETRKKKVSKPKVETMKDGVTEEEFKEKQKLYDYFRKLTNQQELSPKTYILIEDYIKKYQFTYKGMLQCLEYTFEIKGKQVQGDCVGLIPYVYNESQKYYQDIETIEQDMKTKDIDNMYKTKTIKLPPQRQKRVQLLDIESIGVEESVDK